MRLIKLPNGDYVAADAIVSISALPEFQPIPSRVVVQLNGGGSLRIECKDFDQAKQVAEDLAFNISRE